MNIYKFSRRLILVILFWNLSIFPHESPNELGYIPVFAYHKIEDFDSEYTRDHRGFREDLQRLIENGFYPISLEEFSTGKITAPKGKKPFLLTLDDSSISQFRILDNGKIDPNSAIGILEEFRNRYKGFHSKAVFFVLPGSAYPNNYFGQDQWRKEKTEFLLKNGYEIQNHTFWHANLKKYSHLIEEQIAKTELFVKNYAPQHRMYALAVPFGIYPLEKDRNRLLHGSYKGYEYENKLVFDYSNRLSYSPYSIHFNPLYVRRIHGNKIQMNRFFQNINKLNYFFVSDGDPNKISIPQKKLQELHPNFRYKVVFVDNI